MTRQFMDDELLTWSVHASTGQNSLPDGGRLVFLCLTDRDARPRVARYGDDLVEAAAAVGELPDEELRSLLRRSHPLD